MSKTTSKKEYAKFIEKLTQARQASGLKQAEVAKLLKRPQSYISRVESGEYRLDILEVKTFAKLYKTDITNLIQ